MENSTPVVYNFIPPQHGVIYRSSDVFLIIPLTVLSITGTVLNLHALLVYPLRFSVSNHQILITILSSLNMIGCCVCLPLEIALAFSHNEVCKPTRFLSHVIGFASGFMLAVIAVDRYRKICRPYRSQLNKRHIRLLSGIVILISFLLGIPAGIFYIPVESRSEENPLIWFLDCKRDSKFKYITVYFGFTFVLSVSVFIVCIITYSLIIKAIFMQRKQFKQKRQFRRTASSDKSSDAELQSFRNDRSFTGGESSSCNEQPREQPKRNNYALKFPIVKPKSLKRDRSGTSLSSLSSKQRNGTLNNKKNVSKREIYEDPLSQHTNAVSPAVSLSLSRKQGNPMTRAMRLATMFLVASVLSVLWFFPQMLFAALRFTGGYNDVKDALGVGKKIMEYLYFISYVTTPLVYCFMDDKFRLECKLAYIQLFDKIKKFRISPE